MRSIFVLGLVLAIVIDAAAGAPGEGAAGELDSRIKRGSTCLLKPGTLLSLTKRNAVEVRNSDISGDAVNLRALAAGGTVVPTKGSVDGRVIDTSLILVKVANAKAKKEHGWGLAGPWEVLDWAGLDSMTTWTMTGLKEGWGPVPAIVLQIRVLTDGPLLGREVWITGRYCQPA